MFFILTKRLYIVATTYFLNIQYSAMQYVHIFYFIYTKIIIIHLVIHCGRD